METTLRRRQPQTGNPQTEGDQQLAAGAAQQLTSDDGNGPAKPSAAQGEIQPDAEEAPFAAVEEEKSAYRQQQSSKAAKQRAKKLIKRAKVFGTAAAVVVALVAVWYGYHKNPELQEVVESVAESVKSLSPVDELLAKLGDLSQLGPAFNNWTATALGLDAAYVRPGLRLVEEGGVKPKHPVAIVPGFVTSGLELWAGDKCAKKYFRQRMWTTLNMIQTFLADKECWIKHMMLDPLTGLDPSGIRLRSVEGFDAVDFFIQGYWVFSKVVEALADVGYVGNQLACLSYDWRLSASGAEVRDGYFSRMKATMELQHALEGEKVVVIGHSMGDVTARNFFAWVETQQAGWVEEHVAAYINVAGCSLGVVKAYTALLSGELRDTTHLGMMTYFVTESVIPRELRARLWRTWGALTQMLPTGGEAVWGNATWAPDDDEAMRAAGRSRGALITAVAAGSDLMNQEDLDKNETAAELGGNILEAARSLIEALGGEGEREREESRRARSSMSMDVLTVEEALRVLPSVLGEHYEEQAFNWGGQGEHVFPPPKSGNAAPSLHCSSAKKAVGDSGEAGGSEGPTPASSGSPLPTCAVRPRHWFRNINPLQHPLPPAPSLKLYCMYGVGIPTERAYQYLRHEPYNYSVYGSKEWKINQAVTDLDSGLDRGVQMSDGDGTVPLLSLGLMCKKGWRSPRLNPAALKVVSREYKHKAENGLLDPRGGPYVADHVSILGNDAVLEDMLRVVTGNDEGLTDVTHSRIEEIAAQVDFESM